MKTFYNSKGRNQLYNEGPINLILTITCRHQSHHLSLLNCNKSINKFFVRQKKFAQEIATKSLIFNKKSKKENFKIIELKKKINIINFKEIENKFLS